MSGTNLSNHIHLKLKEPYFSGSFTGRRMRVFFWVSSGQESIWSVRCFWFDLKRLLEADLLICSMESAMLQLRARRRSCWGFSGVLELSISFSRTWGLGLRASLMGVLDFKVSEELIAEARRNLWFWIDQKARSWGPESHREGEAIAIWGFSVFTGALCGGKDESVLAWPVASRQIDPLALGFFLGSGQAQCQYYLGLL